MSDQQCATRKSKTLKITQRLFSHKATGNPGSTATQTKALQKVFVSAKIMQQNFAIFTFSLWWWGPCIHA
jgi:hypothetical protein